MCKKNVLFFSFFLLVFNYNLFPQIDFSDDNVNTKSGQGTKNNIYIPYDSFLRKIRFPAPTRESLEKFNHKILGEEKTVLKEGKVISGYITNNKTFFKEIMKPVLDKYADELKRMSKHEAINHLIIFGHEIFRTYFGKDFYRWGGDIFDLDDPQPKGHGGELKYGLDCSGFASMPYQLAEFYGIIDAEKDEAVFSSNGYEKYCKTTGRRDVGGREGTSNNYRLDTQELFDLGREILRIEKGSRPTEEQLSLLKPGDLVGRPGHVGIIVKINDKPYYLESGGWVVPKNEGYPCEAGAAMEIFARRGYLTVRRALSDN